MTTVAIRVTGNQAAALGIYVLDIAHSDDPEWPAFSLAGSTLRIATDKTTIANAAAYLTDAANSADDGGDRLLCTALTAVARKVRVTG